MSRRLVVAGLGNYPYPLTRHSIGQICIDGIAQTYGKPLQFSKKFKGWYSEVTIPEHDLTLDLYKPKAYMNESGKNVIDFSKRFLQPTQKAEPPHHMERLVVLHDDLDLEPGSVKLKQRGSMRGHRGLLSIQEYSRNCDYFRRIMIGIGRPGNMSRLAKDISAYVLEPVPGDLMEMCSYNPGYEQPGSVLRQVLDLILRVSKQEPRSKTSTTRNRQN